MKTFGWALVEIDPAAEPVILKQTGQHTEYEPDAADSPLVVQLSGETILEPAIAAGIAAAVEQQGAATDDSVTFTVAARRTDTRGARTVTVPYFVTVLRGGTAVVSKRVANVTLTFADGQERATATGQGGAYVDRAEATLPADIRKRITRKRKAGDPVIGEGYSHFGFTTEDTPADDQCFVRSAALALSYDKGVLILGSYLSALFGHLAPLALSASIVFEQEYSGVEGDSASCAELYALLSSLSGLPLRQGIAVTGALNQHGEVQRGLLT